MSLKKIDSAGSRGPIPCESLNAIFDLLISKRLSEAEKILREMEPLIRENIRDEFDLGFLQAIKGLILMYKSNDRDTFLGNIDLNDAGALRKYYNEFLEISKDNLHSPYDRGYFSALSEYMLFALRRLGSGGK